MDTEVIIVTLDQVGPSLSDPIGARSPSLNTPIGVISPLSYAHIAHKKLVDSSRSSDEHSFE